MAAEDDIKRIVIEVTGDDLTQREASEAEIGSSAANVSARQEFKQALDKIAEQVRAGEHPEPVLPPFAQPAGMPGMPGVHSDDTTDDVESELTDANATLKSIDETLLSFARTNNALPFASGGGGAGGAGGGQPPSGPVLPFATTQNPILTFASGGGGGLPPIPPGGGGGGLPSIPILPPAPPPRPGPGLPPTGPPNGAPPIPPGPPPVPPGGGAGGLMGGVGELLGALGEIGLVINAVVTGIDEVAEIARTIDQHIMSIADDIRPYSGDVQIADVYAQIRNMQVMIERAQSLGPTVATYEKQRADVSAAWTRIVTKLEGEVLPYVIVGMEGIKGVSEAINSILELLLQAFPWVSGIHEGVKAWAKAIEKNYTDADFDLFDQFEHLIGGDFLGHLEPRTKAGKARRLELFPRAAGVFF